jgi:hypothetical protein
VVQSRCRCAADVNDRKGNNIAESSCHQIFLPDETATLIPAAQNSENGARTESWTQDHDFVRHDSASPTFPFSIRPFRVFRVIRGSKPLPLCRGCQRQRGQEDFRATKLRIFLPANFLAPPNRRRGVRIGDQNERPVVAGKS